MVRPTAARLLLPLSRARDVTVLASVLHVLETPARLEALQLLRNGPRLSPELPARVDELHLLEGIGLVRSETAAGRQLLWTLQPEALERIGECLRS